MKSLKFPLAAVLLAATMIAGAAPARAQAPRKSPVDSVSKVIDKNRITIFYGRPFTRDPKTSETRKIWGGVIPFGQVWRTGANEATTLITQKPLVIGGADVPAGAYTLFTLPKEDGTAKLIVSKELGQWGTEYDETQDLARVDLAKEDLEKPLDQFKISLDTNKDGGATLKLAWEKTQYSVALTVKQ